MAPQFTYSPKTNRTLNNIPLDKKMVGVAQDGYPIYEEDIDKPAEPLADKASLVKDVAAGAGLHSVLSGIGSSAPVVAGTADVVPNVVSITRGPSGAFGPANVVPGAEAGFFTGNGLLTPGAMGVGDYIPGVAGALTLYDLMQNREEIGTGKGYLKGAGAGAGIGMTLGGPVGAGIGAGVGLLANAFGIGGKSRTKVEQDRRSALKEQGIEVPNYDIKEWEENEAFRTSRDEKLLKGGDIENAAQFYGIEGYAGLDQAKKEAIAQKAIDDGLIREHHGTIDLSLTDAYKKYLDEQLGTGEVASSNNNQRREPVEQKRRKKKAILDSIMPPIEAEIPMGPRYDLNPGNLINNPYL